MACAALEKIERLLTGIYDLRIGCRVEDFLVTERPLLPGDCRDAPGTEQLFVAAGDDELSMSLFLDAGLLDRLEAHDPNDALDHRNVADCWDAVEGISHFLCVAHHAGTTASVAADTRAAGGSTGTEPAAAPADRTLPASCTRCCSARASMPAGGPEPLYRRASRHTANSA
jgi:hypothetical protein